MFKVNPLLCADGYKTSHHKMYPENTTLVFSNFTPRSVKYMPNKAKDIVVFGTQYTVMYVHDLFNEHFFNQPKKEVCGLVRNYLSNYLGTNYDVTHFEELWDVGYLPIHVTALPEGTIINPKTPILTIHNTDKKFYWLPNFLETLISTTLWKPLHSASMSYAYYKTAYKYASETDKENVGFVDFQNHDFSMRGMQSLDSAISSALGFLVCSKGTDTLPVLQAAMYYYNESSSAFSVPASEHAVMTAYGKENEIDSFSRILDLYPTGVVAMVSDQYDLWKVLTEYLPQLKDKIMARKGKAVFRPDSGNPADILCGVNVKVFESIEHAQDSFKDELHDNQVHGEPEFEISENTIVKVGSDLYELKAYVDWNRYDKQYYFIENIDIEVTKIETKHSDKGVIELLWDVFGGTINEQGYKVLDSHVGAIYGDSITLEIQEQIFKRLKAKGFASTNVVFGVGSYSMGYATRDSQGSAVKATYIELEENGKIISRNIFKDPITDDGTKKSATGIVRVVNNELVDKSTWEEFNHPSNDLKCIYQNGRFYNQVTLTQIREKIKNS